MVKHGVFYFVWEPRRQIMKIYGEVEGTIIVSVAGQLEKEVIAKVG